MQCTVQRVGCECEVILRNPGGSVVGLMHFAEIDGEVRIDRIEVNKEERGRGHSRLLYRSLWDWCHANGVGTVSGYIMNPRAFAGRAAVFGPPSEEASGPLGWVTHHLGVRRQQPAMTGCASDQKETTVFQLECVESTAEYEKEIGRREFPDAAIALLWLQEKAGKETAKGNLALLGQQLEELVSLTVLDRSGALRRYQVAE